MHWPTIIARLLAVENGRWSRFLWIKIKNLFQVSFAKWVGSSLCREKICWETYFEFEFSEWLQDLYNFLESNGKSKPEFHIVMNIEIINLIPDALMAYPISNFHLCMKWWAHIWNLWDVRCLKWLVQLSMENYDSNLAWRELRRIENFIGNIIDAKIEKFIYQSAAILEHDFQSKSPS